MKPNQIFFIVLALFCFQSTGAQTVPLDTAVHTGVLANSFTYYIRYNAEPKNRVYLYLVNKVGSILEDDDQQGLAHFMEHMNFNGTTHFPKNQLVDYLQKSGVRFGADLNAYTSFDETVYQLPIPSDDPAVLQNGFQIMRDWAQNATLDSVEINKERGVILEEQRLGRGGQERMQRLYMPKLFNQSRYAERIPIGKVDILSSFPPSAIRRFHADWYRPDLQALVVVGDIDINKTEALIKQMFSDLKTPAVEKSRAKYNVPLTGLNQFIEVTDKEMPVTVLQVLIKHEESKLIDERDYLNSMKRQLFNQMISERLAAFAQTPNLPYLQAESNISGFLGGLDAFSFSVVLKKDKFKEGFQSGWEIIEKVKRFGFTETELERAKQNYLNGMEKGFREKDKTNSKSFVEEYTRLFLKQEASPGISWEYQFVKDHIGQVSLDQVNTFAQGYIQKTNRDILIMAPEKDKATLPDSATVISWITALDNETLTAFSDETNLGPLMTTMPVAGRQVSAKYIKPIGATEIYLSNGVRVILKSTDFKNDEIQFAAFSPGGTSLYPNAEYENASNADMITSFGLSSFNPVQLGKILNGKILRVSPYIGERSEGIEGFTTPKDLETSLQLIYLRFTSPRKDTALFNNYMTSAEEVVETRYSDPNNVFSDTVTRVLGNYNFRRTPPTVEKLKQINQEKIFRIYKERFGDASGFTFVFVGNFKTDSIRPLLEKYLGSLPSLHRNEMARDLGIHIPSGQITKKVYKGSENKATVKMVFSGDYIYNAENNLMLSALKGVLAIKITQHLREEESEVYSPSVQVSYNKYPKNRYAFTVSFGCAPANADHLMTSVLKEITALRKNGPIAEDLNKFKAEYQRTHELQLTQNDYWIKFITSLYENKNDPYEADPMQILNKLTTASLKKAANIYLNGNNVIGFELLPESK